MSSQLALKPLRIKIVAADGLFKRRMFYSPNPFAYITVDAEQPRWTRTIRNTLNPYWNESFDLNVRQSSIITVQVFDQKRHKKRDQLLGSVDLKTEEAIDLEVPGHDLLRLDLESPRNGHKSCGRVIIYLSTKIPTPGIPLVINPELDHFQWLPLPPSQPNHQQEPLSGSYQSQDTNRARQNRRSTTHNMTTTPTVQTSSPGILRLENASEPIGSPGDPTAQAANGYDLTQPVIAVPKDIERLSCDLEHVPIVIQMIRLGMAEDEINRSVLGDEVQTSIDALNKALDEPDLPQQTRKKYLKVLYKMCGHHALLPTAMQIPVLYDRTRSASYRGGFADVWKGEHCGRDVAVKVVRTYSDSNLQKILGKFCKEVVVWKTLRHPNVLPLIGVTMSENEFVMISDWMVNSNINDFIKAHPGENRIMLLQGVAKGLIYIHDQEMIHGDLKGANILIDNGGEARLADFGLLTIISDPTNLLYSSSCALGGTARWMSPELIDPQQYGINKTRPTRSSDCYALAMVIYETITGRLPFHDHTDLNVFVKVLKGEHPRREPGFTNVLWRMLLLCWASPEARPSASDVLQHLEMVSESPKPPPSPENEQGVVATISTR